jgi:uncharacterized protein YdeI (YjbR/CyaY-like superfamily)
MNLPKDTLAFSNHEEWRAWLDEHAATHTEAWLLHSKKGMQYFYWLDSAKRPETRLKRIQAILEMVREGRDDRNECAD